MANNEAKAPEEVKVIGKDLSQQQLRDLIRIMREAGFQHLSIDSIRIVDGLENAIVNVKPVEGETKVERPEWVDEYLQEIANEQSKPDRSPRDKVLEVVKVIAPRLVNRMSTVLDVMSLFEPQEFVDAAREYREFINYWLNREDMLIQDQLEEVVDVKPEPKPKPEPEKRPQDDVRQVEDVYKPPGLEEVIVTGKRINTRVWEDYVYFPLEMLQVLPPRLPNQEPEYLPVPDIQPLPNEDIRPIQEQDISRSPDFSEQAEDLDPIPKEDLEPRPKDEPDSERQKEQRPSWSPNEDYLPEISFEVRPVPNAQLKFGVRVKRRQDYTRHENKRRKDRKTENASKSIRALYRLVNRTWGSVSELLDLWEVITWNMEINGKLLAHYDDPYSALVEAYESGGNIHVNVPGLAQDYLVMELMDSLIGYFGGKYGKVQGETGWNIQNPARWLDGYEEED